MLASRSGKMKYHRTEAEARKLSWMPRWKEPTREDPNPEPSRHSKRGKAIIEVLRRLPGDAVERFGAAEPFHWLIPPTGHLGFVHDFSMTYDDFGNRFARVLFLSPRLERLSYPTVVAVVAHELAHACLLSECPVIPSYDAYWENEHAADELAASWGFASELTKLRQHYRVAKRIG
jgi:hypothetical protein